MEWPYEGGHWWEWPYKKCDQRWSGLIKVAIGGSGLIRSVIKGGSGLMKVAIGGSGLIRVGLCILLHTK